MRNPLLQWIPLLLALALMFPAPSRATDVDGPDDCQRTPTDYGDAPENCLAYPGVMGHFPTCRADSPPGDATNACGPVLPPPGPTGFVMHQHLPTLFQYWLGCGPAGTPPMGIDGEPDGKVNDTGAGASVCNPGLLVDCVEKAFGMTFGQDECYGSSDAGLSSPVAFAPCTPSSITFKAWNCSPNAQQVVLNILVDWNHDGDWNDIVQCPTGACVPEWAVQNVVITLFPGCNTITSPSFMSGPTAGPAWMRISISDNQAPGDYAWAGSAHLPGQAMINGETEDYPVSIRVPLVCPNYEDWGDAPENALAYPGVTGHFPTCKAPTPPGTQETACLPARSTMPLATGFVRHLSSPSDQRQFWLGCGDGITSLGVDSETDGKMNDTGGPLSLCGGIPVDGTDFFGITWGQDESYGDGVDAGLDGPTLKFKTCTMSSFDYHAYNCKTIGADAFLNVLVDMNGDGDWNDNFLCNAAQGCAYEWAIKNYGLALAPGCQTLTTPPFLMGPIAGRGWMRITLTTTPVGDDFPWNGSAGPTGDGFFQGGETEDYPVMIQPDFVGVGETQPAAELSFAALSPNPAGDLVNVRYTLPKASDVSLSAYDVAGRKLADLAQGRQDAGEHRLTWNFTDRQGRTVAAGYYLIKLRVGERVLTQRGIRVR